MCGKKATSANSTGDFDEVTCPKCREEAGEAA
jgi:ribosomal protein S27E